MIKISPSVLSADFANMGAAAELMKMRRRLYSLRCNGWRICSEYKLWTGYGKSYFKAYDTAA